MLSSGSCAEGGHSLGRAEGHLEVVSAVTGAQRAVVEGFGEEVMHQSAEGHAVAPAGREVLDIHVLTREDNLKISCFHKINDGTNPEELRRHTCENLP